MNPRDEHLNDDEPPYVVIRDESTSTERREAWDVGAGLQRIDGIEPSPVAYELMAGQIDGRATYEQVVAELRRYYATTAAAPACSIGVSNFPSTAGRTAAEADISAVRIAQIISEPGFTLSAGSLAAIHGRIFDGLLPDRGWEGRFRDEDIRKAESVLGGESVAYTPAMEVTATLRWEFDQEADADFVPRDDADAVTHVLRFISSVWQIHPFRAGNTRVIATYAIKYLRSLGVRVDNTPFIDSSPYFRDALVLDNAPAHLRDREPLRLFGRVLTGDSATLPDLRTQYPREKPS